VDKNDKTRIGRCFSREDWNEEKRCRTVLNAFMDVVTETVKSGEPVVLVGFGKFMLRERKARKGVNPKTREPIDIPAKKTVVFKPGKELRD